MQQINVQNFVAIILYSKNLGIISSLVSCTVSFSLLYPLVSCIFLSFLLCLLSLFSPLLSPVPHLSSRPSLISLLFLSSFVFPFHDSLLFKDCLRLFSVLAAGLILRFNHRNGTPQLQSTVKMKYRRDTLHQN